MKTVLVAVVGAALAIGAAYSFGYLRIGSPPALPGASAATPTAPAAAQGAVAERSATAVPPASERTGGSIVAAAQSAAVKLKDEAEVKREASRVVLTTDDRNYEKLFEASKTSLEKAFAKLVPAKAADPQKAIDLQRVARNKLAQLEKKVADMPKNAASAERIAIHTAARGVEEAVQAAVEAAEPPAVKAADAVAKQLDAAAKDVRAAAVKAAEKGPESPKAQK